MTRRSTVTSIHQRAGSGQVIKVNFDDGQVVRQGDVLVVIDPTDYKWRWSGPAPTIRIRKRKP